MGLSARRVRRLTGRDLAQWAVGAAEPWALVTNDPQALAADYAYRNWEKQAFRDFKPGGFHWNDSLLRDPPHVLRWLVILAVAYA